MDIRHATVALALALGLSGCASYSSAYRSDVVYRDGSYYAPASGGAGDYYYAPEPAYGNYDYYGQDFFYGSPLYGYGGFCSVRYRYCPPFGYGGFPRFGLLIGNGDPYGYYGGGYSWRRDGRHRSGDGDRDDRRDRRRTSAPALPATTLPAERRLFPAPDRMRAEPRRPFPGVRAEQVRSQSDDGSDGADSGRRSHRRRGEGG